MKYKTFKQLIYWSFAPLLLIGLLTGQLVEAEENSPQPTVQIIALAETSTSVPAVSSVQPTVPNASNPVSEPLEPTIPSSSNQAAKPLEPTVSESSTQSATPIQPTTPSSASQSATVSPIQPTVPSTQSQYHKSGASIQESVTPEVRDEANASANTPQSSLGEDVQSDSKTSLKAVNTILPATGTISNLGFSTMGFSLLAYLTCTRQAQFIGLTRYIFQRKGASIHL